MTAEGNRSPGISAAEAAALFADLKGAPGLVVAVSGGPDSTALLFLIARWRGRLRHGPRLLAVTVDHGLRAESRREAAAVKRLAARFGVPHRTVRWMGAKPKSGIQEAARHARYRLLAAAAAKVRAPHVVTAHTLDDQAETVLFRLARGSGIAGLAGMARVSPLPSCGEGAGTLVRPLLALSKARLVATLQAAGIDYLEDASNRDPRYARARLRQLTPALASEGLDAVRLARLAARARRAEEAIEWTVDRTIARMLAGSSPKPGPLAFAAGEFLRWPGEIALRVLQKAIDRVGDEGPAELGKLESLLAALQAVRNKQAGRFRRTLAGAVVTLSGDRLLVERAPPRRRGPSPLGRSPPAPPFRARSR